MQIYDIAFTVPNSPRVQFIGKLGKAKSLRPSGADLGFFALAALCPLRVLLV